MPLLLQPTQEGDIPFRHAAINKECLTHYKVFGDVDAGATPLICLHGGPGSGHEYLLPFANLWPRFGVPVVFYDQIGCASSTRLREYKGDAEVFSVARFIAELENVISYLGLDQTGYHILGHSWGGFLGAEFASLRPQGLRRLVLANTVALAQSYAQNVERMYAALPPDLWQAVQDAVETGDLTQEKFKEANTEFLKRHFYRLRDFPPEEFRMRMKWQGEDPTVVHTMFGKVYAHCDGLLKDWSVVDRLDKISVPTFVYNAEFDPAGEEGNLPFFERIEKVRWYTFPGGAHMCHLEGELREKVFVAVGEFLVVKKDGSGI